LIILGELELKVKKTKIRKDDKVIVIAGKDKGKIGKVLSVDLKKGRLFVENVNVVKRHSKPTTQAPQGGIIEKEASLDISNVMIVCNKCAEPTRIGFHTSSDNIAYRVCKKCNEMIDE